MKPVYGDACIHDGPRDRFLGTVMVKDHAYDVYVYQDNAENAPVPDMHLCLRYGNDGPQYLSPGNVDMFVHRCTHSTEIPAAYRAALPLIEKWAREQRDSIL